jgi:hypothetical protein
MKTERTPPTSRTHSSPKAQQVGHAHCTQCRHHPCPGPDRAGHIHGGYPGVTLRLRAPATAAAAAAAAAASGLHGLGVQTRHKGKHHWGTRRQQGSPLHHLHVPWDGEQSPRNNRHTYAQKTWHSGYPAFIGHQNASRAYTDTESRSASRFLRTPPPHTTPATARVSSGCSVHGRVGRGTQCCCWDSYCWL